VRNNLRLNIRGDNLPFTDEFFIDLFFKYKKIFFPIIFSEEQNDKFSELMQNNYFLSKTLDEIAIHKDKNVLLSVIVKALKNKSPQKYNNYITHAVLASLILKEKKGDISILSDIQNIKNKLDTLVTLAEEIISDKKMDYKKMTALEKAKSIDFIKELKETAKNISLLYVPRLGLYVTEQDDDVFYEKDKNIENLRSLYEKLSKHGIENFFGYLLFNRAEREKNKDLSISFKKDDTQRSP